MIEKRLSTQFALKRQQEREEFLAIIKDLENIRKHYQKIVEDHFEKIVLPAKTLRDKLIDDDKKEDFSVTSILAGLGTIPILLGAYGLNIATLPVTLMSGGIFLRASPSLHNRVKPVDKIKDILNEIDIFLMKRKRGNSSEMVDAFLKSKISEYTKQREIIFNSPSKDPGGKDSQYLFLLHTLSKIDYYFGIENELTVGMRKHLIIFFPPPLVNEIIEYIRESLYLEVKEITFEKAREILSLEQGKAEQAIETFKDASSPSLKAINALQGRLDKFLKENKPIDEDALKNKKIEECSVNERRHHYCQSIKADILRIEDSIKGLKADADSYHDELRILSERMRCLDQIIKWALNDPKLLKGNNRFFRWGNRPFELLSGFEPHLKELNKAFLILKFDTQSLYQSKKFSQALRSYNKHQREKEKKALRTMDRSSMTVIQNPTPPTLPTLEPMPILPRESTPPSLSLAGKPSAFFVRSVTSSVSTSLPGIEESTVERGLPSACTTGQG